jgi:hypothetical protein
MFTPPAAQESLAHEKPERQNICKYNKKHLKYKITARTKRAQKLFLTTERNLLAVIYFYSNKVNISDNLRKNKQYHLQIHHLL